MRKSKACSVKKQERLAIESFWRSVVAERLYSCGHPFMILSFSWNDKRDVVDSLIYTKEEEQTMAKLMQSKEFVQELLPLVGGEENIADATHCASRLRLLLRNEEKADISAIEKMDGVEGVFSRRGQFQIIFGTGRVNRVYKALVEAIEIAQTNPSKERMEKAPKMNPFTHFVKTLSNIFLPIIPAIVVSGLLMGLLGMVKAFGWITMDSAWMKMLTMFSSSSFIILPILIGFSAAKEFGSNPILGAVIGGILTHPSLLNPAELGNSTPEYMDLFGLEIALIGYQGTVIPILLSVYVMSRFEKLLRKFIPQSLDLLLIPFITITFTGIVSLVAIGPLGMMIGEMISGSLEYVYQYAGLVAGFLFGGFYALFVVTGLHHSLHAIEVGLLADPKVGVNFLLPIWSMANVAQGGAALAVFFKSKNDKLKKIAIPAALSSFFGIIEPVMFGINLRLVTPFIGAAIGGGVGGAYVVGAHVVANAYGLTGIPMLALVTPLGISNAVHYLIGLAIAVTTAFTSTWILRFTEEE